MCVLFYQHLHNIYYILCECAWKMCHRDCLGLLRLCLLFNLFLFRFFHHHYVTQKSFGINGVTKLKKIIIQQFISFTIPLIFHNHQCFWAFIKNTTNLAILKYKNNQTYLNVFSKEFAIICFSLVICSICTNSITESSIQFLLFYMLLSVRQQ